MTRRLLALLPLLLALATPAVGQTFHRDTIPIYKGDSVAIWVYGDTLGTWQIRGTSATGAILDRVYIPVRPRPVVVVPPPLDTTPKPPVVVQPPPVDTTKPPVVVPPPVVGSDEPVDPGSGYEWADNFDSYASVPAMQVCSSNQVIHTVPNHANCNDVPAAKYQLTVGRNGTGKALRSVYPSGITTSFSLAWLSPYWGPAGAQHPPLGRSIVIQFWTRIGAGQSMAPVGGKFFEAWFDGNDPRTGGTQRIQWSPGPNEFMIVLGQNPGNTVNRTTQPIGPRWNDFNDGQWHRVTLLYRASTRNNYRWTGGGTNSSTEQFTCTDCSHDGRAAMWIDGKKVMDYSQATVGVTPPGGTHPWATQGDVDMIGTQTVHHLQFPEVANTSAGGMTQDHDDLKVWATP